MTNGKRRDDGYVSLKQLARELGLDRSSCRRLVLRSGVSPVERLTSDSHGQMALTVTRSEADALLRERTPVDLEGKSPGPKSYDCDDVLRIASAQIADGFHVGDSDLFNLLMAEMPSIAEHLGGESLAVLKSIAAVLLARKIRSDNLLQGPKCSNAVH